MGDSAVYFGLADSLSDGRYGLMTSLGYEPDALRPPGYPMLLWFFLHLLRLPHLAVVVIQVGICLGIFYVLQRFLQRRGVPGELLLALALVYPFAIVFSISLGTEAWAMLGLTTVALLLASERLRWPALVLIGLICGITALVRSDLLLLPLVVAFVIVIRDWDGLSKLGANAFRAAIPIVAATFLVLPYALWNQANCGRFSPVPMAGAVGTSLYLTSWQRRLPIEDLKDILQGRFSPRVEQSGLGDEMRALNREVGAPPETGPWNPAEYPTTAEQIKKTQVFGAAGIRRIESDPAYYANHVVRNVWELWNTTHYPTNVPFIAQVGLRIASGLVYLLGLAGMAMAVVKRRRWPIPWVMAPIALYPAAIHVWLHTESRYTASARPLLMLFAAGFLAWLLSKGAARFGFAGPGAFADGPASERR